MSACHGCGAVLPPSVSKPRKWCSERCRKSQYALPCVDCGAPRTNGSDSAREPRCRACAAIRGGDTNTIWTRDAIILAIQEWAAEYGEPPATADWSPTQARILGDESGARRFENDGCWPWTTVVCRVFRDEGSWNGAIAAAGFTTRVAHGGGANVARRRSQRARAAA